VEEFGEDKKEKKAGNIVISGAKTGEFTPILLTSVVSGSSFILVGWICILS
jgi:hypothetical protein